MLGSKRQILQVKQLKFNFTNTSTITLIDTPKYSFHYPSCSTSNEAIASQRPYAFVCNTDKKQGKRRCTDKRHTQTQRWLATNVDFIWKGAYASKQKESPLLQTGAFTQWSADMLYQEDRKKTPEKKCKKLAQPKLRWKGKFSKTLAKPFPKTMSELEESEKKKKAALAVLSRKHTPFKPSWS